MKKFTIVLLFIYLFSISSCVSDPKLSNSTHSKQASLESSHSSSNSITDQKGIFEQSRTDLVKRERGVFENEKYIFYSSLSGTMCFDKVKNTFTNLNNETASRFSYNRNMLISWHHTNSYLNRIEFDNEGKIVKTEKIFLSFKNYSNPVIIGEKIFWRFLERSVPPSLYEYSLVETDLNGKNQKKIAGNLGAHGLYEERFLYYRSGTGIYSYDNVTGKTDLIYQLKSKDNMGTERFEDDYKYVYAFLGEDAELDEYILRVVDVKNGTEEIIDPAANKIKPTSDMLVYLWSDKEFIYFTDAYSIGGYYDLISSIYRYNVKSKQIDVYRNMTGQDVKRIDGKPIEEEIPRYGLFPIGVFGGKGYFLSNQVCFFIDYH